MVKRLRTVLRLGSCESLGDVRTTSTRTRAGTRSSRRRLGTRSGSSVGYGLLLGCLYSCHRLRLEGLAHGCNLLGRRRLESLQPLVGLCLDLQAATRACVTCCAPTRCNRMPCTVLPHRVPEPLRRHALRRCCSRPPAPLAAVAAQHPAPHVRPRARRWRQRALRCARQLPHPTWGHECTQLSARRRHAPCGHTQTTHARARRRPRTWLATPWPKPSPHSTHHAALPAPAQPRPALPTAHRRVRRDRLRPWWQPVGSTQPMQRWLVQSRAHNALDTTHLPCLARFVQRRRVRCRCRVSFGPQRLLAAHAHPTYMRVSARTRQHPHRSHLYRSTQLVSFAIGRLLATHSLLGPPLGRLSVGYRR